MFSVGLVAILLGTLFVYRRVVGPVHALSRAVSGVTDPTLAGPVNVTGPAEIVRLAENFNELLATVKTQLAEHRRDEANARAMLDASLSAIVGMDGDGTIVEWSRQAEATFGWSRDEAMGRPLVSLIVPERYRARHSAGLAEYRRTGAGPVLGKRLELEALRSPSPSSCRSRRRRLPRVIFSPRSSVTSVSGGNPSKSASGSRRSCGRPSVSRASVGLPVASPTTSTTSSRWS